MVNMCPIAVLLSFLSGWRGVKTSLNTRDVLLHVNWSQSQIYGVLTHDYLSYYCVRSCGRTPALYSVGHTRTPHWCCLISSYITIPVSLVLVATHGRSQFLRRASSQKWALGDLNALYPSVLSDLAATRPPAAHAPTPCPAHIAGDYPQSNPMGYMVISYQRTPLKQSQWCIFY